MDPVDLDSQQFNFARFQLHRKYEDIPYPIPTSLARAYINTITK